MGFFKGLIRVVEFDPLLTVEERKQQAAEEAAEATAEAAARAAEAAAEAAEAAEAAAAAAAADAQGEEEGKEGSGGAAVQQQPRRPSYHTVVTSSTRRFAPAADDFIEFPDGTSGVGGIVGGGGGNGRGSNAGAELDEEDPYDYNSLLGKPRSFKVRLYCLRGKGLAAMDMGWGGRPGKSDPYLKVRCGKALHDGRKDKIDDSVDPDFYTCIELDAELPGAPLVVDVMDHDDFTSDDLIGRTVIDLEDRWFDVQGWQAEGAALKSDEPGNVSSGYIDNPCIYFPRFLCELLTDLRIKWHPFYVLFLDTLGGEAGGATAALLPRAAAAAGAPRVLGGHHGAPRGRRLPARRHRAAAAAALRGARCCVEGQGRGLYGLHHQHERHGE